MRRAPGGPAVHDHRHQRYAGHREHPRAARGPRRRERTGEHQRRGRVDAVPGEQARPAAATLQAHGIDPALLSHPRGYGVVTLHRPSNVDQADTLSALLGVLGEVAAELPLVFALHPRTRANIERFGLQGLLQPERMAILSPQGYLEMVGLMQGATMVLTDSGGLQEETTALGVPCLTMRENTERPITVDEGTNTMVGSDLQAIRDGVATILAGSGKRGRVPEKWDGHAAERIAADLYRWLQAGAQ